MSKLIKIIGGLAVLAVLGVVALVVITRLRDDDPNLATSAPEIPTATGIDRSAATAVPGTTPSTAATSSGSLHFVIDSPNSLVKYVVTEKLSKLPVESDAVGTTTAITGDLFLTPQGLASGSQSKFTVDLSTLKTDESLRDRFVRSDVLQTNQAAFKNAVFVAESITGFPAGYIEGQEASMKLKGTMTIHGVSKPVEWDVKARRAGDTLTGIADTTFNMSDYGLTPPNIPTAKSHDAVRLQVTIVASGLTQFDGVMLAAS